MPPSRNAVVHHLCKITFNNGVWDDADRTSAMKADLTLPARPKSRNESRRVSWIHRVAKTN